MAGGDENCLGGGLRPVNSQGSIDLFRGLWFRR